jgi:two-component system cell cycle sensor histidine kinase/response regulator CckA
MRDTCYTEPEPPLLDEDSRSEKSADGAWDSCSALVCYAALIWILLLPSLAAGWLANNAEYLIDTWDTDQGLPQGTPTAMVQTPDGYLWFGTFNGLVRFDGVKFTVFDRSNTPQLPSPEIINLYLDHSGRMWISTALGIASVKDGHWQVFQANSGWRGSYVRFWTESRTGELYVTDFDGRIFEFVRNGFQELPRPPADPQHGFCPYVDEEGFLWVVNPQFIGKFVNGNWQEEIRAADLVKVSSQKEPPLIIAAGSRDGGLWIATRDQLRKYRSGKLVFSTRTPWPMEGFWSLSEDATGTVWICSWAAGAYRFSAASGWRHFMSAGAVPPYFIRFVFQDREHNLWAGIGSGGLQRWKTRNFRSWGTAEGLPGSSIRSVTSDKHGGIIVGMMGQGVARLHKGDISWILRPGQTKGTRVFAFSTVVDQRDRLWVGTQQDGAYLMDPTPTDIAAHGGRVPQVTEGTIYGIFEDSRRNVWLGRKAEGVRSDGRRFDVYRLEGAPEISSIHVFADDPRQGTIWAGTQASGLYRLQGQAFVPVEEARALVNEPISALRFDQDGTLWIGTENAGLAYLKDGRLYTISEKQGLPAKTIGAIVDDGLGYLWLGSNRGVLRIARSELAEIMAGRRETLAVQVFDRSDGLPSMECAIGYQPTATKDEEGNLWFATFRGLASVDPRHVRLSNEPPPVVVEDVLLDDQPTGTREHFVTTSSSPRFSITVPPGVHRLEIHIAGLSLVAPEKLRFRYRVEGLDREWVDLGSQRVIYLRDLKPGRYQLRVEGSNNGGAWSEAASYAELRVQPRFYQTLWFLLLCGFLLGSVGTGVYVLRVRRLHDREKRLQALVEHRTSELKNEVEERKQAEAALSQARDELESRVRQRTQELASAVEALEKDIRERTLVEDELRRTEDKFEKAFQSSPAAMSISSMHSGTIVDVNHSFLRVFGYEYEEVVGRSPQELRTWNDDAEREAIIRTLREKGPVYSLETRFRTKQGRAFMGLLSAEMVNLGNEECFLAVVLDISEQKRLEESLLQAQKMEAIGTLSGGIAHDFNNLLTVIRGYSQIVLPQLQNNEQVRSQVEQIDKAAERAASLTRQLLAFSRRQVLQPTVFDLNGLLLNVEKMLRRIIGEHIELITITAPDLRPVKADPGQMEQVIINLVINARDAMPHGGKLTLETANAELDEAYASKHVGAVPGRYVMLAVSDTGSGMDPSTRAHIFEPFFTTKEVGKGTGLGLSMAYGIVKQSGGNIWVYSEPGAGTTFKIYLRQAERPSQATPGHGPATARLRGTETILLMEDDASVRELARRILTDSGYQVLIGDDVSRVISMCEEYPGKIDLLLTDVVMPGLSGNELATLVTQRRPETMVLYMSGYTHNAIVHQGMVGANSHFAPKPFTPTSLLEKVREALDRKKSEERTSS